MHYNNNEALPSVEAKNASVKGASTTLLITFAATCFIMNLIIIIIIIIIIIKIKINNVFISFLLLLNKNFLAEVSVKIHGTPTHLEKLHHLFNVDRCCIKVSIKVSSFQFL
jgi:hypothetical protein